MGTGWLVWTALLPVVLIAAGFFASRPLTEVVDGVRLDRARQVFRQRRERLEARFVTAASASDPAEAARWEDARWRDDVCWARDRKTGRLLALIAVEFDANPFDPESGRHATALFEYRKGAWSADGTHVDDLHPAEALRRHRRYEPVIPPDRPA